MKNESRNMYKVDFTQYLFLILYKLNLIDEILIEKQANFK